MKKLLTGFIFFTFFCCAVPLRAQFLVTGSNLFSSANYVVPGDDSSSYVAGDFFTYEVLNPGNPSMTSYNFQIGDSLALSDSCGFEHFTNKKFVSKISKNGDVEWINISKNCDTLSFVQITGITSDDNSNLLILGIFNGQVEIADSVLSTASKWDMFLYKISPDGEIIWAKSGFAQGGTSEVIPQDIVTIGNNIYISGSYSGSADFSGGNFQSLSEQFFLLELDASGDAVEVTAGLSVKSSSESDLQSIDVDNNSDVTGILSVKDSVLVVRKQLTFPRDTIFSITGFEEEILYIIDSTDIDKVTAVVDSFFTVSPPDTIHYYVVEPAAISDPTIVRDSVYRPDTDLPVQLHHISVFRGDTLALSDPVPSVPLDFLVDRNDNSLYGLYNFDSELNFGEDTIAAPAFPAALLVKYKFDGGIEWYKTGNCATDTVQATSFSIDRESNIYLAGSVGKQSGNHVLIFDGQSFSASKDEDCFIVKIESGTVLWGQILGDSATDKINDIYALDRFHIVAAGSYSKQLEYDRFSISTSGVRDLFVGTIDPYPFFDLNINVHIDESLPLCEGDSILIVGHTSHVSKFQWVKDSISISGETGDSLWVTTSGSYYLKAESLSITRDDLTPFTKTSGSVNLNYTPYPNDSVFIQDTTIFCYGDSAILRIDTGAGDSCTWYSLTEGFFAAQNHITVTQSNSYYARIEGNTGCISMSDTIEITAIPLPDDSLIITGGNYLFCSGDSLQLESIDTGSNRYIWNLNGDSLTTTNNSAIYFNSGGAYSVDIINDRNCMVRSDTIDLVEIIPPVLSQWFDDEESGICEGEESEIRLSNHGQTDYIWFFNEDSLTNNSPVLYASDEGYYHTVLIKEGVCIVYSDTFFLAVHDVPSVEIGISPDSVICDNENVLLTVSSVGATNIKWYHNGEVMVDSVAPSIKVAENGSYYAKVTNSFSCSASTRSVPVVVKKSPRLNLTTYNGITAFCRNDSLRLFVENAPGIIYQWQRDNHPLNENKLAYYAIEPGGYSVMLEDTLIGCVAQTNVVNLTEWNLPDASLTYSDKFPICDRDTILISSGTSSESYKWYKNDEHLILEEGNILRVSSDGSYYLLVTDSHNCSSVSEVLTFNFLNNPIPPIRQDIEYLFTTDFDNLQWFRDDNPIGGAKGQVYLVDKSGYYHVEVTYENGCIASSKDIRVCAPFPGIDVNRNILTASEGEGYQWFFGTDTIYGATEKVYVAQLSGMYSVNIGLSDGCISRSQGIEVCYPIPEIELEPNQVLKSSLGLSYQWYKNNEPVAGADARLYVVTSTGEYKVEVMDLDQCISFSDPVLIDLTGIQEQLNMLQIYPNPAIDGVNIELPGTVDISKMVLKLHNAIGLVVYEKLMDANPFYLSLEGLSSGVYLLTIESKTFQFRGYIVKQ